MGRPSDSRLIRLKWRIRRQTQCALSWRLARKSTRKCPEWWISRLEKWKDDSRNGVRSLLWRRLKCRLIMMWIRLWFRGGRTSAYPTLWTTHRSASEKDSWDTIRYPREPAPLELRILITNEQWNVRLVHFLIGNRRGKWIWDQWSVEMNQFMSKVTSKLTSNWKTRKIRELNRLKRRERKARKL